MTYTATSQATGYAPPLAAGPPVHADPRFAGVGARVGSSVVDCLVLFVTVIPAYRAEGTSRAATFAWMAVSWLVWATYLFVSYRRWGQTVGKWVLGTRLTSSDGQRVSDRQVLRRIGFIAAAGAMILPAYWVALGRFHSGSYGELSWSTRQTVIEELTPAWGDITIGLYWLFLAASIVAVLLTPRRQSLHDLFAGTAVVSTRAPKVSAGQPTHFGRWHRVLEVTDWTLATLWALAAGLLLIGALAVALDSSVAGDGDVTTRTMFYTAAVPAVLSVLMLIAALNVRNPNRTVRALTHWLAYVLMLIPIAIVLLGLSIGDGESESFETSAPSVVELEPRLSNGV